MARKCPKCGYERLPTDYGCPNCGAIYAEEEAALNNDTGSESKPIEPQPQPAEHSSDTHNNLTQCQDCGGTISKNAEMCPHCGAKGPIDNQSKPSTHKNNISTKQTIVAIVILYIIISSAWSIFFKNDPPKNSPTAATTSIKPTKKKLSEAEKEQRRVERERKRAEEYELCKKDLQCWGNKHSFRATCDGEHLIERFAKYDFEWTDGWGSKVSKIRWLDKSKLTLTYIGDKIKFQNGFGAWQNMIYYIDYDPLNKKLLNVKVRPGRL